ncbi:MAG: WYL domain-containing protein [Burkholderiales bacterium]|nr:WYL domain-containing protein [Burkholderiales bacterium]
MRANRLLSIVLLLQLRVRVTADDLAREFEVSPRTIYRDIDELSAAGIPIYADRGPGGGFQLLDGFQTRLTGLARDEAEAMLMTGLPGPAAELGLGAAAAQARRKLLASLPAALQGQAQRIGTRFHLDAVDWYRSSENVPHLPALTRAVLDQQRVTLTYASWRSARTWQIEPLGIVLKGGHWYLVAQPALSESGATPTHPAAPRIFKVASMTQCVVQDATFARPDAFDLAAWWSAALQRFERDLRPLTATVRATATGCSALAELGAFAATAVATSESADGSGDRVVELPIESIERGALLLLGLGPEVTVLAPAALRRRLHELALDVARRSE